uniref:Uncharacterized protein n=1 Tax=Romanomermis culicivorax TaxID=13658 RepID=A0A915IFY3_ROMCU
MSIILPYSRRSMNRCAVEISNRFFKLPQNKLAAKNETHKTATAISDKDKIVIRGKDMSVLWWHFVASSEHLENTDVTRRVV